MFAMRGIAVSSSVFFLLYVILSLAVCCLWRRMHNRVRNPSASHLANLLFTLRIFPLAAAAVATAAFTVPSFLLLEPHTIDEPVRALPLTLGACGIVLALFGAGKGVVALTRASRIIGRWMIQAKAIESPVSIPVLRIDRFAPPLTAAGILRPRVLLSGAAEFVLNQNELQTALQHEVAHVRRHDNLKKLWLCFVAFPGMRSLEIAWLKATEMAADDAAVGSVSEALDLASALIKLSKISTGREHNSKDLMTAFVSGSTVLINARVERLIGWSEKRPAAARGFSPWYAAVAASTIVVALTITYSQLLVHVHTATEWLVR